MRFMSKLVPLYLFASLLLASCARTTPDSFESPLSSQAMHNQSPLLATPVGDSPKPDLIPTQDPKGPSIVGSIEMQGKPAGTFPATLFLGDPTKSEPVGAYVSLDIETAPRGYVLPDGDFVFPNVPPGTYAILVWTPAGAYVVPDPTARSTWLIEVSGSERFDTGYVLIPDPDIWE